MSIYGGPDIITNGLVLHLDAANSKSYPGSGNTWFDLSGNNNHGTLTNGPTYNNQNKGNIIFDGVNDFGSVSNVLSLRPPSELTVSMYAKANAITAWWNRLFGQDPYTGGYLIFLETGGKLIRALHRVNNIEVRCNTPIEISTTVFTHICFTFKTGDAIRSFFNGVPSTSVSLPSGTFTYNTSNPFLFGHRGDSWFNGQISLIQIYNRALSLTEIQQNYYSTKGRYRL